jgi:lipopolysaccharide export system protein LptA
VEFDEGTGVWDLAGHPVIAARGRLVVRAPMIRYDSRAQILIGSGGVAYRDDILAVSAARVTVWLQEQRATAEGEVAAVRQGTEPITLHAARVEVSRTSGQLIAAGGATLARGSATVIAEQITYDDPAQRAVATGSARLETAEGILVADRIEARLTTEDVTADGQVRVVRGDLDGRADHVIVRQRAAIVELSGGAVARLGGNTIEASAITVDLRAKRVTATGGAHLIATPAAQP